MKDNHAESWANMENYGRKLEKKLEKNARAYSSNAMLKSNDAHSYIDRCEI